MDYDDYIPEFEDLDQAAIGAPAGDCRPEDVGLSGVVIISLGRIHAELRPGDAALSKFSGSGSRVRLGLVCYNLHMCADKCDCVSDFSQV